MTVGQGSFFEDIEADKPRVSLSDRFVVPPFSVLDSRAGYWQKRKAEWLALGIQSELGRGETQTSTTSALHFGSDHKFKSRGRVAADLRSNLNQERELPEWAHNGTARMAPGTSVFDPVICEIAYRWFLPPGGTVLDPFAGGSVRGVVAQSLGHSYTGIDLSATQVEANRQQAQSILGDGARPRWIAGDSTDIDSLLDPSEHFDLLFSCPPYYDLEVYSDDPADLSAAGSYDAFLASYRLIIARSLARLRPNRFAVWVVGEIRDRHGMHRGLVPDTIAAFRDAGAQLYNEAVLLTAVGTLALRTPRVFTASRKLGRSHQSMLVFWRGDSDPIKSFPRLTQ